LVRGDREVNPVKLARAVGAAEVVMADEAAVKAAGTVAGYAGPVGLAVPTVADAEVMAIVDGVTGANEEGYHYTGVNPGRDFVPTSVADIRDAVAGDGCPRCGDGTLSMARGVEVGHIFKLGTKYSESMQATFLDAEGKERPMIMGCYGIGVTRSAAAAIEQNHDAAGIIWPPAIAPFDVAVLPLGPE
ncbi:MAG: proline--tRNA ligase, partial [Nitrospinae bacterium]|nr:proline--tRNA ligase [Nitrospinota bacterium]